MKGGDLSNLEEENIVQKQNKSSNDPMIKTVNILTKVMADVLRWCQ
jgi:hypothetical protein